MNKPQDFEKVEAYTGITPLAPGGHICNIVGVKEVKSKQGKDMIVICLDTDKTDKQPNYFNESYKNDTRNPKKWNNNAIVRQLVFDADSNTNKGFKTFIENVERSNNGFKVSWGDGFTNCFKGKLVGGIFGREEYLNDYGDSKFAVKFKSFRTVDDIKNGVDVPKDKLLNPSSNNNSNAPDIYGDLQIVDNGDMPF